MLKKFRLTGITAFILAVLLAVVGPLAVFAAEDGMYVYTVTDGKATITQYLGSGIATVTLPETLGGYPVVGVDANAFGKIVDGVKPHEEIKNIIFHPGITEIGDRAFAGTAWFGDEAAADSNGFLIVNGILLNYLGKESIVTVPETVTAINIAAFEKNTDITEVVLPASVISISDYSFYKCAKLERIIITGKLESVGKSAFYGCTSLTDIKAASLSVFPDSLKMIGDNAFYGCAALSGTIALGSGLEELGTYAFANCPNLSGIQLPDTVATIGAYAIGFDIVLKNNAYYPQKNENFTVFVTHLEKENAEDEQKVLSTYSKSSMRIYKYATNPDGNGYFTAFNLVWDRLAYPFMMGDVNNDGKVNSTDARALLRHAAKIELIENEEDKIAADTNKDGNINSSDARKVLRVTAKIETFD